MRGHLGNLLLVLGTVLGALAAANSAKASRRLPLEQDAYPGEFVARDVERDDAEEPLVAAGTELSAEIVAELRAAGHDGVDVKDPPVDHEVVATSDRAALEGRVLASPVELGEEDNEVEEGLRVTEVLLARCRAAGMETLDVVIDDERTTLATEPPTAPESLPEEERQARQEVLDEERKDRVESARVAETFTLREPVLIEAGAFLDPERVDEILAADVATVDLRIVKRFRLGGWEHRAWFLAALVAMISGVVLKRAAAYAAGGATGVAGTMTHVQVRAHMAELASKLDDLAARADGLSAHDLHAELDPLLSEDVYRIVESRTAVANKFGAGGFVAVFGPFASAERFLNRAWSAAVDGNADEARESVRLGARGIAETLAAFPGA